MVKKKSLFEEYKYTVMVVTASLLVSIFLALVIGKPLYTSLQKTNDELNGKRAVLEKLEANLVTLKSLESKKAEIEAKNEKVLAALPTDKDVSRLFIQLENIATNAGLKLNSVSEEATTAETAESPVAVNQINTVTYQVSGDANSYSSLKEALNKIEAALRIVNIEKLDIQKGSGNSALTTTFTVKTFTRGAK